MFFHIIITTFTKEKVSEMLPVMFVITIKKTFGCVIVKHRKRLINGCSNRVFLSAKVIPSLGFYNPFFLV